MPVLLSDVLARHVPPRCLPVMREFIESRRGLTTREIATLMYGGADGGALSAINGARVVIIRLRDAMRPEWCIVQDNMGMPYYLRRN